MMNNYFVFHRLTEAKMTQFIHTFNLKKILSNSRTTIYENKNMRVSSDKKVVRVLLFSEDQTLLEQLRNTFYGEKYAKL